MLLLRQPCLGRVSVSPVRGDGDGHPLSQCFQAFVLWQLSPEVCCAPSECQSSSGQISASVTEQRDCRPFSTDVLATLPLLLLVLLNPAASRNVCPTPGVPALTSRASTSLSFVFITLPATSCQPPHACSQSSWSQSGSSEHTWIPEFHEMSGGACSRLMVSVRCFTSAVRKSNHSPVQVDTASRHPNAAAPCPFCLSSDICARFHGSLPRTSILNTGNKHRWQRSGGPLFQLVP